MQLGATLIKSKILHVKINFSFYLTEIFTDFLILTLQMSIIAMKVFF